MGASFSNPATASQLIAAGLATATNQQTQISQISSSPTSTIADDISSQGTPLLHGFDSVLTATTFTVAKDSTTTTSSYTFAKPGYYIYVNAYMSSGSATMPFIDVSVYWNDANGHTIAEQDWIVPAAEQASQWPVLGNGPVEAVTVQFALSNPDPTYSATVEIAIDETTHAPGRHDWRNVSYFTGTVPGYFADGNGLSQGMPVGYVDTLANGSTHSLLFPLYCGQIYLTITSTEKISITLGYPTVTNMIGSGLNIWSAASVTSASTTVALARVPALLTYTNSSGSTATVDILTTFLEYVT